MLVTADYETPNEKWRFNLTGQLNGRSRIPSTESNPIPYQRPDESELFFTLNSQITATLKQFECYIGGEKSEARQHCETLLRMRPDSNRARQLHTQIRDLQLKEQENPDLSTDDSDLEMFVRQWEREFEAVNLDPAENSDFDSDNEVNPLDTIIDG